MNHINYLISSVLILLFIYITFIRYGSKSIIHKTIFLKCEDKFINEAFSKLDITGKEYMEEYILKYIPGAEIIMRKNEGIGASVRSKKIYLNAGFNDKLFLESFRDILHEFRHVLDIKLSKINIIISFFTGASLIILLILFLISFFIDLSLYKNINLFRITLSTLGMIAFSISSMISISLENNAIRHVVITCNERLKELKFENHIINKIYEILSLQAAYISEWYTMQIVAGLFFILGLYITLI